MIFFGFDCVTFYGLFVETKPSSPVRLLFFLYLVRGGGEQSKRTYFPPTDILAFFLGGVGPNTHTLDGPNNEGWYFWLSSAARE